MNLNIKNFSSIVLPYKDINSCKKMMLKLYEKFPYLPELPLIDNTENIYYRTIQNIPGITIENNKFILPNRDSAEIKKVINNFDKYYNADDLNTLSQYYSDAKFMEIYIEMLKRFHPQYTLIRLLGPFSFCYNVINQNNVTLLCDRNYRKFIIQFLSIKSLWFINEIKKASPDTKPIILFDEHLFNKFSTIKRTSESVNDDTYVTLLTKIINKIKVNGAFVGVQSYEKCNWLPLIQSGIDIISFDVFNNPNNLSIISEQVYNFLKCGGYINWGIIPTHSENVLQKTNVDMMYKKLKTSIENLASEGIPIDLLYRRSLVSTLDNLNNLPVLFAEKALLLSEQLSKKIFANKS